MNKFQNMSNALRNKLPNNLEPKIKSRVTFQMNKNGKISLNNLGKLQKNGKIKQEILLKLYNL